MASNAGGITVYGQNFLANLFTGQTSLPSSWYLALLTGVPDSLMTGTTVAAVEAAGGPGSYGYARLAVVNSATYWTTGNNGLTGNVAALYWPIATGSWGGTTNTPIAYFGVTDAATAGNLYGWGAFADPKVIISGYQFWTDVGGVVFSFGGTTDTTAS
jgi:hypothetical protein